MHKQKRRKREVVKNRMWLGKKKKKVFRKNGKGKEEKQRPSYESRKVRGGGLITLLKFEKATRFVKREEERDLHQCRE